MEGLLEFPFSTFPTRLIMRFSSCELMRFAYGRYALGAFNVCNLEQIHGLFRGATRARAPIIVQFTRAMRDYAHATMLEQILRGAELIYPEVPFAVHLDHGDEAVCADAIASGHFGSVMIDSSHLPFEQNILATARVVERAQASGLRVEAELGQLKGVEDESPVMGTDAALTDPVKAMEFVNRTRCDSLAVAIGTSHGANKFTGMQRLDFERLKSVQRRLPGFPLVLHGASAVPLEEIRRINEAGGRIGSGAGGVDPSELKEAIRLGITKVNIGTDGRLIWTRIHREFFRDHPDEFNFMSPGRVYMDEYALFVERKCEQLGTTGMAPEASNFPSGPPQKRADPQPAPDSKPRL
jgi:fructose-bisphosphate aldolase class II